MVFETTRFGQIEVPEEEIIRMARGMPGLDHLRRFVVIPHPVQPSPFLWFQSLDTPEIAFVLISPQTLIPSYQPDIPDETLNQIEAQESDKVAVFNVVNFTDGGEHCFANLCAPIVLNMRTRAAIQVILDEKRHPVRHELFTS